LQSTEVGYDHEKSVAAKQAAKKAEILAIETYKKTHSQKLTEGRQLPLVACYNNIAAIHGASVGRITRFTRPSV